MNAKIIVTESGERLAVLPEALYLELLDAAEEIRDLKSADGFYASLDRGDEEFLPSEFVVRLLSGDSPMLEWRVHRGLTIQDLAEKAGLTKSRVAEIELKPLNATPEDLGKIALALSVQIEDLLPAPQAFDAG